MKERKKKEIENKVEISRDEWAALELSLLYGGRVVLQSGTRANGFSILRERPQKEFVIKDLIKKFP